MTVLVEYGTSSGGLKGVLTGLQPGIPIIKGPLISKSVKSVG